MTATKPKEYKSKASKRAHNALKGVVVERVSSPVFQIAQRVRDIIQEGDLTPGTRLPSTRELAEQLDIDISTVHRALSLLVKEGLLVRTPYVGTFVTQPPTDKLERLGFYFPNGEGQSISNFGRALLEEITRMGHDQDFTVEVFSDTRKADDAVRAAPDDLMRNARTRYIQGVLSCSVSPERSRWLEGLPIPFATISTTNHPHAYNWSRNELAANAVQCLARRGCKRIGMVTSLFASPVPGCDNYQLGLYNGFARTAQKYGLEINPNRMIGMTEPDSGIVEQDAPECGYKAIARLWDELPAEERPDGLFIYPDTLTSGVLLALAERGIKVPRDLNLVLHSNAEIPVFCPYPADRIVVKVADAAKMLVQHIRNQLQNHPESNHILPCYPSPYGNDQSDLAGS